MVPLPPPLVSFPFVSRPLARSYQPPLFHVSPAPPPPRGPRRTNHDLAPAPPYPERASRAAHVATHFASLGAPRPIYSVLVANNGNAASKFIRSIRLWSQVRHPLEVLFLSFFLSLSPLVAPATFLCLCTCCSVTRHDPTTCTASSSSHTHTAARTS